mmetsp:Transcript_22908/g.53608  ORF Transcript_22908/g.53608 Transcript_22908/m.53608 type:complete len:331 (-) Transcript_22908:230-1222(-)
MSIGCGTLGGSSGFFKGTLRAASGNGRQHTLPSSTYHPRINAEDIEAHWDVDNQTSQNGPTRVWGQTTENKLGGEDRVDGEPNGWTKGEFWNTDSNINIWNEHQVRRNHASSSHDVHRHDQMRKIVLPQHPGEKPRKPKFCVSGVISPDANFMEAWGFDLGLRDRQARCCPRPFLPARGGEQFRAHRSFQHDLPKVLEHYRTLKRTPSEPGRSTISKISASQTLRPDDPEAAVNVSVISEDHRKVDQGGIGGGKTHGSKSCRGWDAWDHVVKREGARTTHDVMSPYVRQHREGYPFVDELDLRPSAVYSRRYQRYGEDHLRRHQPKVKQP